MFYLLSILLSWCQFYGPKLVRLKNEFVFWVL